ncbi:calcium-translocating P-type ATPase, SERCA-type [Defluviitalea phaphyphila]|uniref:calcium-translocating P-type ATPase, SERCA-type n=1 Tax=Defluviitalea phaphyphila TaxID=1473580 RepID=UPI0007302375|nr:calcium-translocating P-type ATPase, SERCA-type [Defluviitalea phaphyphila]
MESFFNKSVEEVVKNLKTNIKKGISQEEALKRREKYGENRLREKKGRGIFSVFLDQFKDFLVIILIIASIVSFLVKEEKDAIIILTIVILNALLGVFQENRAGNALKALKDMAAPRAKVIRDGSLQKVLSSELVLGDIVVLEAGDYIPADLRLIESVNLKVQESILTGESISIEKNADKIVEKDAGIGDRINCVFMGTIVTYGRGKGVVIGTGMNTEIGKVASMLEEVEEEKTPLQKKLSQLGKLLGSVCLGICIIIFILGMLRGEEFIKIFMTAVSLAVAAIPEGLPTVVTVVLALGMQKMIKRNAIIKTLGGVETLGSTTVICTDKTGTLTQNKMTVIKVFDGESTWNISGKGYIPKGEIKKEDNSSAEISKTLEKLLMAGVLCNDAEIKREENDIIGDPTEGALVVLGAKGGYIKENLIKEMPRIGEIPFDSDRKLMSTFHKYKENIVMYTKGAPDVVLSRCKYIDVNGKIEKITDKHKEMIINKNNSFANEALRVLALSYKIVSVVKENKEEEKDLVFLGLVGMMDPPRDEAKKAVEICKKAGIRVVMITGDHKTTGSAIGRAIGIIDDDAETMDGKEIDVLSDEELKEKVKNINVFARVSPEHKVRIVKAIKANGEITAMTGDGVNDAPSLKQANIGIAMGITGTDVAKEAADMILTDDNFSSIVNAVEEGRIIYSNIRKFVGFLLSCNIGELLLIFMAMLIGTEIPLLPIHLLWINLITDAFPAFALGLEPKEEGIMELPPRDPEEAIVNKKMAIAIGIQSIGLALAAFISFWYGMNNFNGGNTLMAARTYCFATLVIGELLRAYSARSEKQMIYKMKIFSNKLLNISVISSILLLVSVIYIPYLQYIFNTVALPFVDLGITILFAVIPTITGEIAKKNKIVFTKDKLDK